MLTCLSGALFYAGAIFSGKMHKKKNNNQAYQVNEKLRLKGTNHHQPEKRKQSSVVTPSHAEEGKTDVTTTEIS
jgi:hypothetical protein